MSDTGVASRVVAARVLAAVLGRGRSLKAELGTALPSVDDPRDRALVEAICFAALRRRPVYVAALKQWLARPLGRRDGDIEALLMAGLAQLDGLALPAHAALSATVEACRALGHPGKAGMVNAILRRAQREGLPEVAADAAWPGWLRDRIVGDWGPELAQQVFLGSAQAAPLWLRVNRRHGSVENYLARLHEAGLDAVVTELAADALCMASPVPVALLPGFDEGDVSIQDLSAQQVADLVELAPGRRVLDACAAPGGKAAHLLEHEPALELTAMDVDGRRLRRAGETLARTGATAVELKLADAADTQQWWDGTAFDTVLLDAPCSATGVVRRQPDILAHRREQDLTQLVALQARLLDACWKTLRPGGTLVYTTCSVLQAENAEQLTGFLARTADARAEDPGERHGRLSGPGRQRLPGEHGGDGFFYARLIKGQ